MPIDIIRGESDRKPQQEPPEMLWSFWPRLQEQWRQNPGFVAATAAGSLGLLLTLAIVIQGGIELLDESAELDEPADDFVAADLGDSDDAAGANLTGLFDESSRSNRSGSRLSDNNEPETDWETMPAMRQVAASDRFAEIESDGDEDLPRPGRARILAEPKKKFLDDADDIAADDPDELMADERLLAAKREAAQKLVRRAVPEKNRNPLAEDDVADDADEEPVIGLRSPPRRQVDVNPFDDEPAEPRRNVRPPVDVVEAVDLEEIDDIPTAIVEQPSNKSNGKSARLQPPIGPDLGSEDPTDESEKEVVDSAEAEPAIASEQESPSTGWRNQPTKPLPPPKSAEDMARHSRAVETIIYATPANEPESRPASDPIPPRREQESPRLALQISGPRSATAGENCNFEIRVKNTGSVTAHQLNLSVELPAGLIHAVAQSVEQQIETLAPGQTYRALLRLRAQSAGKATLTADVAIGNRVATRLSTSILVNDEASGKLRGTAAR